MGEQAHRYAAVPVELLRDPKLSPQAKAAYAVLASYEGHLGVIPSQATVCAHFGCSDDALRRWLNELVKYGAIARTLRHDGRGLVCGCEYVLLATQAMYLARADKAKVQSAADPAAMRVRTRTDAATLPQGCGVGTRTDAVSAPAGMRDKLPDQEQDPNQEQAEDRTEPSPQTAAPPSLSLEPDKRKGKPRPLESSPPDLDATKAFFAANGSTPDDGERCWLWYKARFWRTNANKPLYDWDATMRGWIKRDDGRKNPNERRPNSFDRDDGMFRKDSDGRPIPRQL